MPNSTCSVDGCEKFVTCRGWCGMHYNRWRKTGKLGSARPQIARVDTLAEAFRFYMPGDPPPAGIVWPWAGQIHHSGYGDVKFGSRTIRAHRVSYELFVGPIPDGLVVRHKNDIRADVNPNNLELGTQYENVQDRINRGRSRHDQGEECTNAKLTDDQVHEIRRRRNELGETLVSIAGDFGVSHVLVSRIARRKAWKHLE